jgi:hypothetical protein
VQERLMVALMRIGGVMMLLAFVAVLLPESWMAATHGWLGMGTFPAAPLVNYLTRSISMLYGIHGALFILLSTDVRRFAPAIGLLAGMHVIFGLVMIVVDLRAPMPWYWTLAEGPPITALGLLMLYLLRAVVRDT